MLSSCFETVAKKKKQFNSLGINAVQITSTRTETVIDTITNVVRPKPSPTVPPIATTGFEHCGAGVNFTEFKVEYFKKTITVRVNGTNPLNIQNWEVNLFVYFDPRHQVKLNFTNCAQGEIPNPLNTNGFGCFVNVTNKPNFGFVGWQTNLFDDDGIPDIAFEIPGMGSYAVLTLLPPPEDINNVKYVDIGCLSVPIGNPNTAYFHEVVFASTTIVGLGILFACGNYLVSNSFHLDRSSHNQTQYDHQGHHNHNQTQYYHQGHHNHNQTQYDHQGHRNHNQTQYDHQGHHNHNQTQYDHQGHHNHNQTQYDHQGHHNHDQTQYDHQGHHNHDQTQYDHQSHHNYNQTQYDHQDNHNHNHDHNCEHWPNNHHDNCEHWPDNHHDNGEHWPDNHHDNCEHWPDRHHDNAEHWPDSHHNNDEHWPDSHHDNGEHWPDNHHDNCEHWPDNHHDNCEHWPDRHHDNAEHWPDSHHNNDEHWPDSHHDNGEHGCDHHSNKNDNFNHNVPNIEFLSNAVNKLRETTICAYMNICDVVASTGYIGFDDSNICIRNRVTNTNSDTPPPQYLFFANTTNDEKITFNNPNGFSTYASIFKVPDMNLFFVVFISFLIAMATALVSILLIVLISFALKKYWKKWPKVEYFAQKSYLFVYGGLFRVGILHSRTIDTTELAEEVIINYNK
ncbi:3156_t:CDS:2 [Entrophospora sp. SA101]|nr:3156_t:CDS:2 [Entrophospora sp. SA101]